MSSGRLRIIAGELRGRRIQVPAGTQVRPTADRVREALFNILGASVSLARVLDAYCGSGALGFEALSRGARSVEFLDSDRQALQTLRGNAVALGVQAVCGIRAGDVLDLLRGPTVTGPFDLILADPPYGSDQAARFLPLAAVRLAEGGRIVVERDRRDPAPDAAGLVRFRTTRYGRCCLDFFQRPSAPAS